MTTTRRDANAHGSSDALDDAELARAFASATLAHAAWDHAAWDHAAHLRIAWMHLERDAFARALERLREGIRRLNAAHGVPSTPTGGYHETLTVAWLRIVAEARRRGPDVDDARSFVDLHGARLAPERLLDFYSRKRLRNDDARRCFVEPDRMPLPEPGD